MRIPIFLDSVHDCFRSADNVIKNTKRVGKRRKLINKKNIFDSNAKPLKAIIFLRWNKLRFVKKEYFNIHAIVTVQLHRRLLVPPITVPLLLCLNFTNIFTNNAKHYFCKKILLSNCMVNIFCLLSCQLHKIVKKIKDIFV